MKARFLSVALSAGLIIISTTASADHNDLNNGNPTTEYGDIRNRPGGPGGPGGPRGPGGPGHPGFPGHPGGPGGGWHRPRPPRDHYRCQQAQYVLQQAQYGLQVATMNLGNSYGFCGNNPGCIIMYQNAYNQAVVNVQTAQREVQFACGRFGR